MKSLRDLQPGQELVCLRTGAFSRDAELLLRDDVLATLKPQGFFSSRVAAESADGRWIIARQGLLSRTTLMTEEGRPAQAARFVSGFWGRSGRIQFPDGRGYAWRRTAFWTMEYAIERDGVSLVHFRHKRAWFKTKVEVVVEPAAAAVDHDLPILVLFGCHLILGAIAAARAAAS